jgi:hypothetical protein
MQKVRRFRAMGSLCRQQAAYNPAQSWKLLAEAEYWEHLAEIETSSHFEECNMERLSGLSKIVGPSDKNDTGDKTMSSRETVARAVATSNALKAIY